ncbi:uncharacterized protein TNCV_2863581 [Trichonephila clavipes]|nr:uncharacterized protein TNCV_2863581 [Trichonephila clavipes]
MKDTCYMLAVAWDSLERQSLKKAWNRLWPDLKGEKYFNNDHREEITDFVQSIPGFQECDEEDVETWMAFEADYSVDFKCYLMIRLGFPCKQNTTLSTMKLMKTRTTLTKVARVHQMLARFLR